MTRRERQSKIVRYLMSHWDGLEWGELLDDVAVIFWLGVHLSEPRFRDVMKAKVTAKTSRKRKSIGAR